MLTIIFGPVCIVNTTTSALINRTALLASGALIWQGGLQNDSQLCLLLDVHYNSQLSGLVRTDQLTPIDLRKRHGYNGLDWVGNTVLFIIICMYSRYFFVRTIAHFSLLCANFLTAKIILTCTTHRLDMMRHFLTNYVANLLPIRYSPGFC